MATRQIASARNSLLKVKFSPNRLTDEFLPFRYFATLVYSETLHYNHHFNLTNQIRSMKKYLITSIFFALFSLNATAGGVGILDVEKIIKESAVMRDIQSKVSKKQDEYQKEVTKKQDVLESDQKKLEAKRNILSKDAFEKETKAFEKKIDELKTFVDKKQNSLKKASMDSMGKINDKIKDLIADISKEQDLDIIIPASQTLFYKDQLDISAEVLKRLNKKISKFDVKFE